MESLESKGNEVQIPDDQLLSATKVAEALQHQVTRQAVTAWCRSGKLKAQRAGKKWLIRWGDLQEFLKTRKGEDENN